MGVLAVDFDDTIRNSATERPCDYIADILREVSSNGHEIVVWTGNSNFDFVRRFMNQYKIPYSSINKRQYESNLHTDEFRKLVADVYIDDRAVNPLDGPAKMVKFLRSRNLL